MPVRSAAVNTVDQVLDMDMSVEGLKTRPSRIRQWFTNNIIRRMFAYPLIYDGVHFKLQRATKEGVTLVAPVGGGLNATLKRAGSSTDSYAGDYFGELVADQIMVTVWDKPIYFRTSWDRINWGAIIELNADTIYCFDLAVQEFKLKSKTAGQHARYEVIGFFKV